MQMELTNRQMHVPKELTREQVVDFIKKNEDGKYEVHKKLGEMAKDAPIAP